VAVSALAGLALQGTADVGASLSHAMDVEPVRALLATRLGHAHVARLALLLAIAVTLWAVHARRAGRPGRALSGLLLAELATVVGTVAVEGHAAAGAWPKSGRQAMLGRLANFGHVISGLFYAAERVS
jgi:putative copper export protein